MIRVCASAIRLIARALDMNLATSGPDARREASIEVLGDIHGNLVGFDVRRVMVCSPVCVFTR
jgi:hypothetical protein